MSAVVDIVCGMLSVIGAACFFEFCCLLAKPSEDIDEDDTQKGGR